MIVFIKQYFRGWKGRLKLSFWVKIRLKNIFRFRIRVPVDFIFRRDRICGSSGSFDVSVESCA